MIFARVAAITVYVIIVIPAAGRNNAFFIKQAKLGGQIARQIFRY